MTRSWETTGGDNEGDAETVKGDETERVNEGAKNREGERAQESERG